MRGRRASRAAGFTLLELLVAMGIFAIIGAMAMGGLNAVVGQATQAGIQNERLARLQRAMRLLSNDLGAIEPRFVRDQLGSGRELPVLADGRGTYLIRLTRGGWSNPAGLPHRGTLQRVQYRLEEGTLYREYWAVVDVGSLGQEPRSEELLTGVREARFLFYDGKDTSGEWEQQWPPLRSTAAGGGTRPRAIQVTLDLEDWGEIERIVEVPQ